MLLASNLMWLMNSRARSWWRNDACTCLTSEWVFWVLLKKFYLAFSLEHIVQGHILETLTTLNISNRTIPQWFLNKHTPLPNHTNQHNKFNLLMIYILVHKHLHFLKQGQYFHPVPSAEKRTDHSLIQNTWPVPSTLSPPVLCAGGLPDILKL